MKLTNLDFSINLHQFCLNSRRVLYLCVCVMKCHVLLAMWQYQLVKITLLQSKILHCIFSCTYYAISAIIGLLNSYIKVKLGTQWIWDSGTYWGTAGTAPYEVKWLSIPVSDGLNLAVFSADLPGAMRWKYHIEGLVSWTLPVSLSTRSVWGMEEKQVWHIDL